jgi:hypothetical protein
MNLYKLIQFTYNKLKQLFYNKLLYYYPDYNYKININDNNLNLYSFTLETLNPLEFNTLLSSFNISPSIIYIYLFDTEGRLIESYEYEILKSDNLEKYEIERSFIEFSTNLIKDIAEKCIIYEINNNFFKNKSMFYIHISNECDFD